MQFKLRTELLYAYLFTLKTKTTHLTTLGEPVPDKNIHSLSALWLDYWALYKYSTYLLTSTCTFVVIMQDL